MHFLKKHFRLFVFIGLTIIFVGQYFFSGVSYAPDTAKLEAFSEEVYPLYPLILYFFRFLFGSELGYGILGVFQNLLLVIGIFSLVDYMCHAFCLKNPCCLLMFLVISIVFLAQRWFTRAGIISSNTLFSEALSIPLYLIFFRYTLETFLDKRKSAFFLSCFFAACLILTRGQLYWCIVVIFINGIRLTPRKESLVAAILACLLIVGCVQGARYLQTLTVRDTQTKSPLNSFLLTTAIYCSDKDDTVLFEENSGEKQLFDTARAAMDSPAHLAAFSYESGGLTARQSKFETYYDRIKALLLSSYASLQEKSSTISLRKITWTLILDNPIPFLLHCVQNALTGLIRTVAILKPGINLLACLFFAFMSLCLIFMHRIPQLLKERRLVLLSLLCSLLNALTIAPGVFALSRYMIYNMPIMYLSAIVLLRALIMKRKIYFLKSYA